MIKKISELSYKEKRMINNGIFILIIIYIIYLCFQAYSLYSEYGFNHCAEVKDVYTGINETVCFNTSKELKDFLLGEYYPKNIDYKYINNQNNVVLQ